MDLLTPVTLAALLYGIVALAYIGVVAHDALLAPRFLKPADKPLLNRMKKTGAAFAPVGPAYWQTVIGAHLGHAIGLLLFAILVGMARSGLLAWLRLPLLAVGCLYTVISWKCWVRTATGALATATALLAAGWLG